MLRARVCDPAGPRAWRAAAIVGALPLTVVALVLPLPVVPRIVAMLLGVAWLVVGRVVVPRLRPRSCSVELETGAIRLRRAGMMTQRIMAGDVRAASTAHLARGSALGLVRNAEGDPPLWLDLESRDDLADIKRALRIGRGFGSLDWPPQRGVFHITSSALDVIASFGWIGIIVAVCEYAADAAGLLAVLVAPLTLFALVLTTFHSAPHAVSIRPDGLYAVVGWETALHPWASVTDARVEGDALVVETTAGRSTIPMHKALPAEREHMAAQIRSAGRRARGEEFETSEVPPSVAVLAPRDEGTRTWLERLDATAATLSRGDGYRDAGVVERDLWSTLESPDAPVTLRVAAARILARTTPQAAGPRIAQAIELEHDEAARLRIRIALEEDVDVAARQLDRLDLA